MRVIKAMTNIFMRIFLIVSGVLVTLAYIAIFPVHLVVFIISGSKVVEMTMFGIMNRIYEKLESV